MAIQIDSKTYRSPNYNERPANEPVNAVVVHTTEGTFDSNAEWMCDPSSDVSTHYEVAPNGSIYELVSVKYRAWHAGESYYAGRGDWNDFSIGVELSHLKGQSYTNEMRVSLDVLMRYLIPKYKISSEMIAMHRWVATPYGRKSDATDWSDTDFNTWKASLYEAIKPIDPLKVRQIQGATTKYYCGVGFYDTYYKNNGIWWLGYPMRNETRATDQNGRDCTYMTFERAVLKYNSQEGIRTALDSESLALGWI